MDCEQKCVPLNHKLLIQMKKGLVLEGGGMRALFTEGFLDVMLENGVKVDGMMCVSGSALFGCNYKSHQVGRGLRYNIRFKNDPRYMGWKSFVRTGNIVGAEFAYHTMPMELDVFDTKTFADDPTEFHMVCTDIETGDPVYRQIEYVDDPMLEWFRATSAMPVVSTPVEIDGKKMLDGGIVDCIPLKYFQEIGYERNIVIMTRPVEYMKKPTQIGWLFKLWYRKYPHVAEAMARRHKVYNHQREYIKEQGDLGHTLLVYPDFPLKIGRTELDENKLRAIYEHGREKGLKMLDEIRDFLNK